MIAIFDEDKGEGENRSVGEGLRAWCKSSKSPTLPGWPESPMAFGSTTRVPLPLALPKYPRSQHPTAIPKFV